jgi:hypothetical protein
MLDGHCFSPGERFFISLFDRISSHIEADSVPDRAQNRKNSAHSQGKWSNISVTSKSGGIHHPCMFGTERADLKSSSPGESPRCIIDFLNILYH